MFFLENDEMNQVAFNEVWGWKSIPDLKAVFVTVWGDWVLVSPSGLFLFQVSYADLLEIGTCEDELAWMVKNPSERAPWLHTDLLPDLPKREHGSVYHFIHPLGLNGTISKENVTLLPFRKQQIGLATVFRQIDRLSPGTEITHT